MNDIIKALQFEKEQLEARIRLLEDKLESDNRQISGYDHELRQAKRLLKAAVEDIHSIFDETDGYCTTRLRCDTCPASEKDCTKWRYADEALALIGEKGEDDCGEISEAECWRRYFTVKLGREL